MERMFRVESISCLIRCGSPVRIEGAVFLEWLCERQNFPDS